MLHDPSDGQPPACLRGPEVGPWNDHGSRPVDYKCQHCDQPGVRFFDRQWCCEDCGQAVLYRLSEELVRPAPKPIRRKQARKEGT